jgi:hypothetical protein
MANGKTRQSYIAAIHATVYSVPFLWIGSWRAVLFIAVTHFLVDRFRLARFVVFAKNHIGWPVPVWEDCKATGYPSSVPVWLAVWLTIIADNTIHLICNDIALEVWK